MAECREDFYYLFIWAVWVGSSFALRRVLQVPCGSRQEVCVLIRGQKSLTAPGLQHTDTLLWVPPSCCASLEPWGQALSRSTFCSHYVGGAISLISTTGYTQIDAKEWMIGGNLFSQVNGSCSCDEVLLWLTCSERVWIWCMPLMSGGWMVPQVPSWTKLETC